MAMGKAEPCPSGYEITTKEDCELAMRKYNLDFVSFHPNEELYS